MQRRTGNTHRRFYRLFEPGGRDHTAAHAGPVVPSQYGIVEAANELELVSFCESLSVYPKPIEGRVGIVTVSGGHGAMAIDACTARGITVPELPEKVREDLRKGLSPSVREIATLSNPIDLTGSGIDDDFVATAEALFAMEEIDCVLALLLPYIPGITSDLGAEARSIARRAASR